MSPLVETTNFYLALGGIASFLFALILVIDVHREQALRSIVRTHGLTFTFAIAFAGTLTALVYSEVFGFVPCGLCWLARIFLFPQVVLLGVALYYRDTGIARYGLALSLIGGFIGLYHHYLQMGGTEFVKCPAAGAVDCAKRIMFEFDFMTFPLLGVAGFALLSSLYYYMLRVRN